MTTMMDSSIERYMFRHYHGKMIGPFLVFAMIMVVYAVSFQEHLYYNYDCNSEALLDIPEHHWNSTASIPTHVSNTSANTDITTTKSSLLRMKDFMQQQEYRWLGNHWIPRMEIVPTYTPQRIRNIWTRHNILWVGDSNARQGYASAWSILMAEDEDVSIQELNNNLNVNKKSSHNNTAVHGIIENCTLRDVQNENSLFHHLSMEDPSQFICRSSLLKKSATTNTTKLQTSNSLILQQKHGKYDYRRMNCLYDVPLLQHLEHVSSLEHHHSKLSEEYDVIIVEMSIWEIMDGCQRWDLDPSQVDVLTNALESLHSLSTRVPAVIVKTVGFSGRIEDESDLKTRHRNRKTDRFNARIRNWFQHYYEFMELRKEPVHLFLLDWGTQMIPRSIGKNRIEGDLPPHWGVEGRTLSSQMLTHTMQMIFS